MFVVAPRHYQHCLGNEIISDLYTKPFSHQSQQQLATSWKYSSQPREVYLRIKSLAHAHHTHKSPAVINSTIPVERKTHFVVPFTQESQLLSPLVHKYSIQLAVVHCSDLNGLRAPAHDVRITYQSWIERGRGGR